MDDSLLMKIIGKVAYTDQGHSYLGKASNFT